MKKLLVSLFCVVTLLTTLLGCSGKSDVTKVQAISGVREAAPEVPVGPDGLTSEQRNIKNRLKQDNQPGAIKHLYVFSAYSGQCLLYSTVKEKVTSSGKRLSPTTVHAGVAGNGSDIYHSGIPINVSNRQLLTGELIQDDGTYGSSIDYLYWYDQRGIYHQHYLAGGQILHISTEPMPVKSIIINVEKTGDSK